MNIYTENRRADGYNVIGTIRGSVEPGELLNLSQKLQQWHSCADASLLIEDSY